MLKLRADLPDHIRKKYEAAFLKAIPTKYLTHEKSKSDYPNSARFKKQRVLRLKMSEGKCEVCGLPANQIHHIDKTRTNHSIDNLIALCTGCHGILHTGSHKKTSKYIRLYGITLKEMVNKYGGSINLYYQLHENNKLDKHLKNLKERGDE